MLVLLSFGLVLVATVLLVLGLLADDGLTLIYISIACSVLAGIVLVLATRMGKPKARTASSGPEPLADTPDARPTEAAEPTPEPVPASASVAESLPRSEPADADESFAPEPVTTAVPPVETTAAVPVPVSEPEPAPEDDDEDFFPIADYDDLTVNEILPLLPELYADEIGVVEERERQGKSRVRILNRLAELREVLADAPPDTTAAQVLASRPPAKKAAKKKATARKATATAKTVIVEPTDETAKRAAPTKKTTRKKAPAKKASAAKKASKATKATKATENPEAG